MQKYDQEKLQFYRSVRFNKCQVTVLVTKSCRGIREKGRYLKNHVRKGYSVDAETWLSVFLKTANDGEIYFS